MIVLTAALGEANDLTLIWIFAGTIWLDIIPRMVETASLRCQWRKHTIPVLSRITRKGGPHTSEALGRPMGWDLRNTNDHSNKAVQFYWTKPKGYSRRTAEIERITRRLMRWISVGTALLASRLVVLHITNHNWLSVILSKLYFASDITDRAFHFEIIMVMYNSILMICLATVFASLVTIVLVNRPPRHLVLIWSSLVLAMFFLFRIRANGLTLFLLHVVSRTQNLSCNRFSNLKHTDLISQVLIAATNALILSPLQSQSQDCISFSVEYPRLRLFLCLFLWLLSTNIYYIASCYLSRSPPYHSRRSIFGMDDIASMATYEL
jgi:hypothetical protein